MVQIKTHYSLVDKDTSKVSRTWKVIHIILLLTAAVSGFITSYSLGEVNRAYGSNCVLYGEIVLAPPKTTYNPTTTTEATTITVTATATGDELVSTTEKEDNGKKQSLPDLSDLTIDIDRSEWGTYWMCSFCQFTPLMSMIFALCWIAFFVMCGPGGAGYPSDLLSRPWRIVYPALLFSSIFSLVLSASTIHLSRGLTEFCRDFKEHIMFTYYKCIPEINDFTTIFWDGEVKEAYVYSILCFIFSHVGVIAWWTHTIFLILRVLCVVDFDMYEHKRKNTDVCAATSTTIKFEEDLKDEKVTFKSLPANTASKKRYSPLFQDDNQGKKEPCAWCS